MSNLACNDSIEPNLNSNETNVDSDVLSTSPVQIETAHNGKDLNEETDHPIESLNNENQEEGEELEDEEDGLRQDDLVNLMNSLTGQPNEDDLLVYALPICAPYTTLFKYKFKVKITPGIIKRGTGK